MDPFNPVELTIFQKQLDHISQKMGWVMTRTARSPIFSEAHDFSSFIADSAGNVVAQADGIPIHTGGASYALRAILKEHKSQISPDDLFLLSDPYEAGGNHLPDWTMVRPVFHSGEHVAFTCNRAHQSDIGGGAAGSYNPAATEIFHEGIRLPVLRLVQNGEIRKDLWKLLLINSRCPDLLDGDLRAMMGATEIGARNLKKLLDSLDEGTASALFTGVLDHAERVIRTEIEALPDGIYEAQDASHTDCFEAREVPVRLCLEIRGNELIFDFTGSHPQIRGFKNSPLANTVSAVFVGVLSFLGAHVPRNDGALRSLKIVAPEGTIVNAQPPAAVTMCTMFPAAEIINVCWQALAEADPNRASGGWGKACYCSMSGELDALNRYNMPHWHGSSGAGAVAGRDGFNILSQVICLGGLRLPNVETYEQLYPIHVERYEFRTDSAGAGEFRGGTGIDYLAQVDEAAEYSFRGEGLSVESGFGVLGGVAGAEGVLALEALEEEDLPAPPVYGVRNLPPLRLTIRSPGGGGWGNPINRSTEAVARDVADGIISIQAAADVYGVVIDHDGSVKRMGSFSSQNPS